MVRTSRFPALPVRVPCRAMAVAVSGLLMLLLFPRPAGAQTSGTKATFTGDIEYANAEGISLKLDLYVPKGTVKTPLVVYVHGGGWREGSKDHMPLGRLVQAGYAVASVDYRLSSQAQFPAMIHDLKAAIRFLRAEGNRLGLKDTSRIVIAGSSAGGHLAAVVGVTNGVKELEGTVGAHLASSSAVQGTISFFGASDLLSILGQSTPKGREFRGPALELLLGGLPQDKPELAKLASPVMHVDATDPPLLLIHGDADAQMPHQQSVDLKQAYVKAGAAVQLITIRGAGHGGKEFHDTERTAGVVRFLQSIATP